MKHSRSSQASQNLKPPKYQITYTLSRTVDATVQVTSRRRFKTFGSAKTARSCRCNGCGFPVRAWAEPREAFAGPLFRTSTSATDVMSNRRTYQTKQMQDDVPRGAQSPAPRGPHQARQTTRVTVHGGQRRSCTPTASTPASVHPTAVARRRKADRSWLCWGHERWHDRGATCCRLWSFARLAP